MRASPRTPPTTPPAIPTKARTSAQRRAQTGSDLPPTLVPLPPDEVAEALGLRRCEGQRGTAHRVETSDTCGCQVYELLSAEAYETILCVFWPV